MDANSFGTLVEADAYHETVLHLDAPWPAGATNKVPALIMGTQWLTALVRWTGWETTLVQALPWPRTGMYRRNDRAAIPASEIPPELKWAQFELARLLLTTDRTLENIAAIQGIEALSAGPVSIKFSGAMRKDGTPVLATVALDLLVPSWIYSAKGHSGERELLRT